MSRPHVQVVLADHAIPDALRAALERTGATASFWPLAEVLHADPGAAADAVVIVLPARPGEQTSKLRLLFDRLAEHPRAALVLVPGGEPLPILDHPPAVPVVYAQDLDAHDLAVRLETMIEMRPSLDSLRNGLVAGHRSGDSAAQRYLNQLRLASQVQRGFLPASLPRIGPASFQVLFRPVDFVSGDIYDVQRLDEEHVGIALADASGHGIPAALLTVYIKRALRGKEIENGTYRILSPGAVLAGLNDDVLDAQLNECPFVAAVYAILNLRTLRLALARGGAPYPLHRTAAGEVRALEVPGSVVGVLPGARFAVSTVQLAPGDSVLFYTDGLDRIVAPQPAVSELQPAPDRPDSRITALNTQAAVAVRAAGGNGALGTDVASAVALGEAPPLVRLPGPCRAEHVVAAGDWFDTFRAQGLAFALEQLSGRQRALRRMGYPLDDLTVIGVEIAD